MNMLDLTLPSPEENLACDEALLELCEQDPRQESLRFWEPAQHFVVVGYGTECRRSVNLPACRRRRVPVLRRLSGGGAVLQGPGCLNYSLVLQIARAPAFASVAGTNAAVMELQRRAIEPLVSAPVRIQGDTDLTLGDLKFSGNSQRRRRHALLFHGTLLLELTLPLMQELLPVPEPQPAYRRNRPHTDFVTRLPVPAPRLKQALQHAWGVRESDAEIPSARIRELAQNRYSSRDWNFRR